MSYSPLSDVYLPSPNAKPLNISANSSFVLCTYLASYSCCLKKDKRIHEVYSITVLTVTICSALCFVNLITQFLYPEINGNEQFYIRHIKHSITYLSLKTLNGFKLILLQVNKH
jgi:hypothetical protein